MTYVNIKTGKLDEAVSTPRAIQYMEFTLGKLPVGSSITKRTGQQGMVSVEVWGQEPTRWSMGAILITPDEWEEVVEWVVLSPTLNPVIVHD